ncbi:MaoC/PaaZ C-terminal domain-containing protein [Streptomyces mexicanus]|jgi:acyl dehydratase|uniref:MaoC/PaaZ C-terminal domain-containing protein n=1 Tax=Streptomyces mexicanus TaxID=178566 RepID=UPI0031EF8586
MNDDQRTDTFTAPIDDRYFDNCTAGATHEYGSVTGTQDEIVDFSSRYDPQSVHVDPVAAERGPFGRPVAGGWHTSP